MLSEEATEAGGRLLLKVTNPGEGISTNHWWVILIIVLVGCCLCAFGAFCQCNIMICTHTVLCCCCVPHRLRPRWARKKRKAFAEHISATEEEEQIQLADTRRIKAAERVEKLRQELEEAEAMYQVNTEIFALLTARSVTGVHLNFDEIDDIVRSKLSEVEQRMEKKDEDLRAAGYKDLENVQQDALEATKRYVGELTARESNRTDEDLEKEGLLGGKTEGSTTRRNRIVKGVLGTILGKRGNTNVIDADGNVIKPAATSMVAPMPGFYEDEQDEPKSPNILGGFLKNSISPINLGPDGKPMSPEEIATIAGLNDDYGMHDKLKRRSSLGGIPLPGFLGSLTARSRDQKISPEPEGVPMKPQSARGPNDRLPPLKSQPMSPLKSVRFDKGGPSTKAAGGGPLRPPPTRYDVSDDSEDDGGGAVVPEAKITLPSVLKKGRRPDIGKGTGMTSASHELDFLPLADDDEILAKMESGDVGLATNSQESLTKTPPKLAKGKKNKKSPKKKKGSNVILADDDSDGDGAGRIKLPSIPKLDFARLSGAGQQGRLPF